MTDAKDVNCSERPNSSDDLIRRRDAIDAMCSVCGNDCDKSEFVYDAPQWEQVILCPEHYALSVLPSAQQEPCEDAVSDLIEEQAAKRLNDLIFDINPAEICSQIRSDNLRNWCKTIQTEMKMAMVQLPCWAEERKTDE